EQALELGDVAVDRLLEFAVGAVAPADLVERLLALQRIEPARERVALAAVIAVPQVHHGVVIHHAGDVGGDRVERVDAVARRLLPRPFLVARRAGEEIGEPAGAAVAGARFRTRGRGGARFRRGRAAAQSSDAANAADTASRCGGRLLAGSAAWLGLLA